MALELEERIKDIDQAILEPVVRQLLYNERVVVREWRYESIEKGGGGRVFRFAGSAHDSQARDENVILSWSLILKVPRQTIGLGDPYGGTREPVFYRSGFATQLPAGIGAPRCLGVVDQPGGEQWIWLEEVDAVDGAEWALERYGAVARRLGRFNGAFLMGYPLPAWSWLASDQDLRDYVNRFLPSRDQLRESLTYWQENHTLDEVTVGRFLQLYDERERFLIAIEQLPQTLCHNDADQRNLLWRSGSGGEDEVIAVDWAFVGLGAVGREITTLVDSPILFSMMAIDDLPVLDAVVFRNYVQGLADAGWRKDVNLVRLGYAASCAIKVGLVLNGLLFVRLTDAEWWQPWYEKFFGAPIAEILVRLAALSRYQLVLADEARAIMDTLA